MRNYQERMKTQTTDHGLNERHLKLIKNTIKKFAPNVETVSLFGSRAIGSHKSYSDIDMVLYGDVQEHIVDRLWTCFNESNLPYKVDLVAYNLVNSASLKAHIDQFAKPLFLSTELKDSQPSKKT